ncbi:hypothetical protein ACFQBQ_01130 [Granulicella cerasi]|uniref:Uncharacterized protein n=1 Tax=Granulicella cerasi TaxID=741063 RepID=A0ABW1Z6C0_9BACT|nr:hypothetical protein [Granulicella cerasi]
MKTIVYRGGVVAFRVPATWLEEYSDVDGGMFYEDTPDSGTLRVKVITMESPKPVGAVSARDNLDRVTAPIRRRVPGCETRVRADGHPVFRYSEMAFEQGVPLILHYWIVANELPPNHLRLVTFSYTVLASRPTEEETLRDLDMLFGEIESAVFASELGNVIG